MSMDKPSSAVLLRGGTQRPTPEAPRRSSLQSNVEQFKLLQAMGARPVAQKHVSLTTRASALSHDSLAHARRLLVPLPTPSGTPFAHPPLVRPASTSAAASLLHHHTNNFPSTSLLLDRNSTICNAVIVLWNNKRKLQALRQWRDVTTAENVRLRDDFVQRVRTATKDLLLAKAKAMHDECAMVFTPAQVDTLVTWALQIQTKSFVGVKPSMVEDLVQHMALRTYADKTCLFMEGDVGQFYYILFTGAVGIYRTLRAYHYATYSKAQKIAFLPCVDIFAEWLQAKIAAFSDLLERHELSFGYRVLSVDRPIESVYFVVSGDIQVTQRWLEPVPDQPVYPQFKPSATKSIDIQVERVIRRGVLGLPLLLSDGVKAKVDATVVTASAEVYVLKAAHLTAFRSLLPTSGTWQLQQEQRHAAFKRAVAALNLTEPSELDSFAMPTVNHPSGLGVQALPVLPIMVSTCAKKFLVEDWDLLVDRSDKPVPTVFIPSAPLQPKPVNASESRKIACQTFTDMASNTKVFQWNPQGGFQGSSRAIDTDGRPDFDMSIVI
ncbi:hypothetical protein DYB38_005107 [Aphanomyces astaci]|uniref:Cyclic nucleotide-binding domain-containing protein n=1 Tax=Aphanomyces astaci TaxID=112090 RepID=A0A397AUA2_APHAT|nr:hypothetical protein DYB36_001413 [Aphanomyces astaci]RHY53387.1 hypothetical protein DYB38_005107 [Aphanomyces astaci]